MRKGRKYLNLRLIDKGGKIFEPRDPHRELTLNIETVQDLAEHSSNIDPQLRTRLLKVTSDLRSRIDSATGGMVTEEWTAKLDEWNAELEQCMSAANTASASELSDATARSLTDCITRIKAEASDGFLKRLWRRLSG